MSDSKSDFIDAGSVVGTFKQAYEMNSRSIIDINAETLRLQNDLHKCEEAYEREYMEQVNLYKKKAETDNEVGTLRDLAENSQGQYRDFSTIHDDESGILDDHIQNLTNIHKDLGKKLDSMEEELNSMSAELDTKQHVAKHK